LHYVYFIISKKNEKIKSYVGYTKDLKKRIIAHNNNRGAKSTKGRKWKIIFKKKFNNKSAAMKWEYFLKKNKNLRKKIKEKYAI
tara:strand:+ start:126 stop:377 length:252 start_codon:yes stop_codon:yes gene_type:complete